METGGPAAVEILLMVLGAPAVLVLTAYGVVFWLQKQSRAAVRVLGTRIQNFSERLTRIADFLQEFIGINQEPYSTHLDDLQQEATDLQAQIEQFLNDSRDFEAEINSAGIKRLQDIINAPFYWYRRWRRGGELRQESQVIDERLTAAEGRIERINDLPWELASQCRQAEKDVAEIVQTARDLQAEGARGPSLQTILTQSPQLTRAVNEIPVPFLQADQAGVIAAANLDATIRVFEVLNRLRPAVGRYLPQVREWHTAYQKAAVEFTELKQAGASLRQAMAQPPEGLVVNGLRDRLDQTAQLAADLGQRLSQPEVEDLKPLAREISQLRRVIQDTEHQLKRASQQAHELRVGIGELNSGLEKLSSHLADLETRNTFPLVWDQSSQGINDLRRRLEALGQAHQPRTPEQILQHLKETETIRAGHKTHTDTLPRVTEQHRALVALLESPEIKEGAAWLRKARETATQAAAYDPRNWPKTDAVQTVAAELDELSQLHNRLIPADTAAPIKESELGQRLKDTQQVLTQHKGLRTRVESVRARLEKIIAEEKEGKDKLTGSYTALERVALLTESNELLDELASAEIDRLSEEFRQLGNELNARGQGEVDKKLQKIQAETDKVNRALNGWLAQLNAAIVGQGKLINDRLIQLDSVALLDEPAVIEARSVLTREAYLSAQQNITPSTGTTGALRSVAARVTTRTTNLNDLEATADIKRKNDLWQTLLAVHQALEERTAALLAAYGDTVKARTEAREALAEVVKRLPDRRTWPPCNQPPLTEAQLLRPIDDKWDGLKKQARRVEPAVVELGRLTQQYQLAAERADQVFGRIEQDTERVQDLEEQIGELKQRWQGQAQAAPTNGVIREGVQQLMSQADSKLAYIKQQYMRGALSYEQVIQNLQLLSDELLTARVSVDDQNDIGLNETHRHVQQT